MIINPFVSDKCLGKDFRFQLPEYDNRINIFIKDDVVLYNRVPIIHDSDAIHDKYYRYILNHDVSKFRYNCCFSNILHLKGTFFLCTTKDYSNYGHFLAQIYSSLLYCTKKKVLNRNIKILVDKGSITGFRKQLFDLFSEYQIMELDFSKIYQIETLIYTDQLFSFDKFNNEIFEYYNELAFYHRSKNKSFPNKFYITRGNAPRRKVINDQQVIEFCRNNGYSIIDTAQLSVFDQMSLFYDATNIIAAHGASGGNFFFINTTVHFIELFNENFVNSCNARILNSKSAFYACTINRNINNNMDLEVDIDLLNSVINNNGYTMIKSKPTFREIDIFNYVMKYLNEDVKYAYTSKLYESEGDIEKQIHAIQQALKLAPSNKLYANKLQELMNNSLES